MSTCYVLITQSRRKREARRKRSQEKREREEGKVVEND